MTAKNTASTVLLIVALLRLVHDAPWTGSRRPMDEVLPQTIGEHAWPSRPKCGCEIKASGTEGADWLCLRLVGLSRDARSCQQFSLTALLTHQSPGDGVMFCLNS